MGSISSAPGQSASFTSTQRTLGVVALGPIVTSSTLAVDEGVGTEELSHGSRTNKVENGRLEIDLDGPGDILVVSNLHFVSQLITLLITSSK